MKKKAPLTIRTDIRMKTPKKTVTNEDAPDRLVMSSIKPPKNPTITREITMAVRCEKISVPESV